MSQTTYTAVSSEELADLHGTYWTRALKALSVPETDEQAVQAAMPYRTAQSAYEAHVEGCTTCQDSPWWSDDCATGARLATIAADAMCAQEDLASQN